MGKSLLLLLTAVILGGTVLSLGQQQIAAMTNEDHRENTAEAYTREVADAGRHAILADALLDGQFKPSGSMPTPGTVFSYGGGEYELVSYTTQQDDHRAIFTITGRFPYTLDSLGNEVYSEHTVTSTYEWSEPCFPGHLMFNSPAPKMYDVEGSILDGTSECGGEPAYGGLYFDAAQHAAYLLEETGQADLGIQSFAGGLSNALGGPNGFVLADTAGNQLHMMNVDNPNWTGPSHSSNDIYEANSAPQPIAIMSAARGQVEMISAVTDIDALLSAGTVAGDVRFEGLQTLDDTTGNRSIVIGTWTGGSAVLGPEAARVAYFDNGLIIEEGFSFSGTGVLAVNGDLIVDGTLNWDGLVLVRSGNDVLSVEAGDDATITIRGSLVIDHIAAPPGGHMDLTVWRDIEGSWADLRGENDRPGSRDFLRHTHRFGNVGGSYLHTNGSFRDCSDDEDFCPVASRTPGANSDDRVVTFKDPATNWNAMSGVHEKQTYFHKMLKEISNEYGNELVYLTFADEEAREDRNGLASVSLALNVGGTVVSCEATPVDFLNCAQPGDRHKTQGFRVQDLRKLEVNIASLRLLRRMINYDPVYFPSGESMLACLTGQTNDLFTGAGSQCFSKNHPGTISFYQERQGALRLQLRHASNDKLLYEAAMYWHTKEPDHDEHDEEMAADAAFYAAIANGEEYGARLSVGDALTLSFDVPRIGGIVERLGFDAPGVAHTGSTVSRQNVEAIP